MFTQVNQCDLSLHSCNIPDSSSDNSIRHAKSVAGQAEPTTSWPAEQQWHTVPELTEILGLTPSRIRRLIEDHALAAVRVDGVLRVPVEFLRDNEPMSELRGTLVLLEDSGFTNEEAVHWLLTEQELLGGVRPIDALRAGRKAEVRRVAQSLSF